MIRANTWVVQITVTATATSVKDLLITAWATIVWSNYDAIDLNAEAAIRYSSNWTPTATTWMQIATSWTVSLRWINIDELLLIRVWGSDVKVNIEIWRAEKLW